MPRNIVNDIEAMIARVRAAFALFGSRKAGTPSAMASMPVSAVEPDANARSTRNRVTPAISGSISMAAEAAVVVKQELKTVDFHERETDGVDEYTEHWASLESFKRVLEAAIKSGFFDINSVVCDPVQRTVLKDDPGWSLARYGVSVEVCGTMDSFLKLYTQVHKPRKFVSLCIDRIRRDADAPPERLEGVVTAWGLRIEKTRETGRTKTQGSSFIRTKR